MRYPIALVLISTVGAAIILGMLLALGGLDAPNGAALTLIVLVGLILVDWMLTRDLKIVSPVRVYLLIALAVFCFGWAVHFFSYLGPGAALLLAASLGTVVLVLTLRRRVPTERAEAGLCARCGYDLRASDSRCPECNSPIPDALVRRRRIAQNIRAARQTTSAHPTPHAPRLPTNPPEDDAERNPPPPEQV